MLTHDLLHFSSLQCSSDGGQPSPEMNFMVNGDLLKPERIEYEEEEAHSVALVSLTIETASSLPVSCSANNRVSPAPLWSDEARVYIKRK